jgi:hypothetical protein
MPPRDPRVVAQPAPPPILERLLRDRHAPSIHRTRPTAVENLNLSDAYARYGAKIPRGQPVLSAIAGDGTVVISCYAGKFGRTRRDVLRYEGTISTDDAGDRHKALLGQHLVLARDGDLPVHLVIVTPPKGPSPRIISVRPDLVGKVTEFDGDHFIVDFSRIATPAAKTGKAGGRRKS